MTYNQLSQVGIKYLDGSSQEDVTSVKIFYVAEAHGRAEGNLRIEKQPANVFEESDY